MIRLNTGHIGGRPMIFGRHGVVSSGHYLASEIGNWMLRRGGNAADAAAAMGFALALLKPHQNGIAGEAPTLVRWAGNGEIYAISGHGPAPAAATVEYFRSLGIDRIPGDGFLPAIVPPMVDTYLTLLARFGTMRLVDVLAPSVQLARDGFAMYDALANTIAGNERRFRHEWPTSAGVFLPGGRAPQPGELFRNPDWADTFELLIETSTRYRDRIAGIEAAGDVFYRGPIARRICQFAGSTSVRDASGKSHTCVLTIDDFAGYHAATEEPVFSDYRGWRVYKCGPWTQGPAMLQTLNMLEDFDLARMGHNSVDAIHTIVEAMKLAYADREFYYGDPASADVDMQHLLSKGYAAERCKLIDPAAASRQLRPGQPRAGVAGPGPLADYHNVLAIEQATADWAGSSACGDTTKLEAIDSAGNVVSATVSGGWLQSSPVIEGLGFPLGTRGQMFSLDPSHPNCVAPGKRPRSTLTPSIAVFGLQRGRTGQSSPGMPERIIAFGSPGGDAQDQWAVQFFLNVVEFGMGLQQAIEAPTVWSNHWPISFYPRSCRPGELMVEGRISEATRAGLTARGHIINVQGDWSGGNTLAAMFDSQTGLLSAAASPRLDPSYAIGF